MSYFSLCLKYGLPKSGSGTVWGACECSTRHVGILLLFDIINDLELQHSTSACHKNNISSPKVSCNLNVCVCISTTMYFRLSCMSCSAAAQFETCSWCWMKGQRIAGVIRNQNSGDDSMPNIYDDLSKTLCVCVCYFFPDQSQPAPFPTQALKINQSLLDTLPWHTDSARVVSVMFRSTKLWEERSSKNDPVFDRKKN